MARTRSNAGEVHPFPVDHLESRRSEAYVDDRSYRAQIRRERSSAYWFAAAKWGMAGLVFGMFLGAGGMYMATIGALPIATDAMERATAMETARRDYEAEKLALPASTPAQP